MPDVSAEDERFLEAALAEARAAEDDGEVPVGAVVVFRGRVIGRGRNRVEATQDPTAHAEIIAIGAASQALKSWRLDDATLYVTLEPCHMCAGAAVLARLSRLVYGARDPKAGACGSLAMVPQDLRLNHRVEVVSGVLAEECGALLAQFFKKRRPVANNRLENGL
ncbi:MAG TPA: tRNA adenosine(34) deaminase TadA [Candidatus Limnocylindrales bacterium]|nr:tRNA adenosine(34) deaminase TadA [Candidatus Limnocylindrales bacterium]